MRLMTAPDGVRAGAKRLGQKRERGANSFHRNSHFGICTYHRPSRMSSPPSRPTSLSLRDLNHGGRLVFFPPTVIDEYNELDLDSMLCDGWNLKWSRTRCRISLTPIRKSTSAAYPPPTFDLQTPRGGSGSSSNDHDGEGAPLASPVYAHVPAHRDFCEKYFRSFKAKKPLSEESGT
ncbi:hypothetical protein EDB84DRAFT_1435743 [Lactarius hengduanensis]|nr:hypothetical protein EDB84DRAFT_1435743 [Lactarius hengduanensis]